MAEKEKKDSKKDKPMTREEALEQALKQIEKAHGKGAIMRLGEAQANMNIEVISTGILPLDIALGVGGIPRGRIIEVYGPESSGKTTVTLHMIAEAQKAGGVAAFIDAEHALDPEYAKRLGVNIEELLISQPDTGEQALEIVDALVRSGAVDIIVVDSVAALVPKSEIDEDMGSSHESGNAQAHGHYQQDTHGGHLYQPAPRKDRRYLRQPGDDNGRACIEILCIRAYRCTAQ